MTKISWTKRILLAADHFFATIGKDQPGGGIPGSYDDLKRGARQRHQDEGKARDKR